MPSYGCSDLSRLATFDLASPEINFFFAAGFRGASLTADPVHFAECAAVPQFAPK
jgi:hypothetical protein